MNATELLSPMRIADVERDTGIGKDTLRVWERRYDFPKPTRDDLGDRIYPAEQIERLRVIRRLLDKGMRPSKVLGLDASALYQLLDAHSVQAPNHERHALCLSLVKLLRMHRSKELRECLNQILVRDGLQKFITDTIVPMNGIVGDYWIRGNLTVPEEHLYTEQVQNVIRHAIHSQGDNEEPPRILFTTFPDEEHCLGILMVEAMCVSEGAQCTSLGTRIPLSDISKYAVDGRYDVVALSFSAAYPSRTVIKDLKQFRDLLPEEIAIWVGGAALNQRRIALPNTTVLTKIEGVPNLVADWRARR
jgi:DNA-binding transcriptional MerR regulator/methylmalonyl-CoA mutase cobalamin-binding subunit